MKSLILLLLLIGCLTGCTVRKGNHLIAPETDDPSTLTGVLVTDRDRFEIDSKYVSTLVIEVNGRRLPYTDNTGKKITYTIIFIYDKPITALYISNGHGLPYKIILE